MQGHGMVRERVTERQTERETGRPVNSRYIENVYPQLKPQERKEEL